jgi:hypothetical protein
MPKPKTSPQVARMAARRAVERRQANIFIDRQDRGREKIQFEVEDFGEWFCGEVDLLRAEECRRIVDELRRVFGDAAADHVEQFD